MSSNKCKNCCFCLVTAVYLSSAVRFYLTCRWQRVSNERSLSRLLALSLGGRLVCLSLSDVLLPRRPDNFGSTLQIERKSCSYCRTFLFFNKNTKQDRMQSCLKPVILDVNLNEYLVWVFVYTFHNLWEKVHGSGREWNTQVAWAGGPAQKFSGSGRVRV